MKTAQKFLQFATGPKEYGFVLKLDFEKAYNIVEWVCIFETMNSLWFSDRWIFRIKSLLLPAKVSILVNGERGPEIACKRGWRQGLSPLIFVLVANSLNFMILNAVKPVLSRASGVKIPPTRW